ncbi:hypothetical protein [uncultured Vagococcus sp.]|uniref:hypothetical protein n=1 Tax=uncultured Vagococcus sp. TaxID=189676 RepID=UPI0028D5580B|nr:hypothetical protein [uncultured Vagococcus sp.]
MTPYEFELRTTAYKLKRLDEEYNLHLQAWLAEQVKASKKVGKKDVPYFKNFNSFFDYQKKEREILGMEQLSQMGEDKVFEELFRKASL